jgi:hypothetical protein
LKPGTRARAKRRRREAKEEVRRQLLDNEPDWKDRELAELRDIEFWSDHDFYDDWQNDFLDDCEGDYEEYDEDYDDEDYWGFGYERVASSSTRDMTQNLRVLEDMWERLTTHERIQVEWMVSKAAEIASAVLHRTNGNGHHTDTRCCQWT